jgi:CheY-like chemotaxis protein
MEMRALHSPLRRPQGLVPPTLQIVKDSTTVLPARPAVPASLLIVDDDTMLLGLLSAVLEETGVFEVRTAEDGLSALESLAARPADAVLTDIRMPRLDGLGLIARLAEQHPRTPVAVMSAHAAGPEAADELSRAGIAAVFAKPLDMRSFPDAVQRLLVPATTDRVSGVTLFGFLQLLEMERKTCAVVVRAGDREGRLFFEQGALVHAEHGAMRGLTAAYDVTTWEGATLEILNDRRSMIRTITASLRHVLMEGARLLDHRRAAIPAGETSPPEADAIGPDEAALAALAAASAAHRPRDAGASGVTPSELAPLRASGSTAVLDPAEEIRFMTATATLTLKDTLNELLKLDGAIVAALCDAETGMVLGSAGDKSFNIDVAASGNMEVLRAKNRVKAQLGFPDSIEDILITLTTQYHLIRPLSNSPTLFFYLAIDRQRGNLGMARHKLASFESRVAV